ncbi:glutathione S-transferase T3-like isoform X2 [Salvia splendens]|uniref:glutathione S-transferase T3-like isoform X2 n=1 Tax=Salvia splendens TaxID=180675 RepID=UPI001C280729|nr:glutathione S-transferase T3-like isoform X2 [Salvia splendens]
MSDNQGDKAKLLNQPKTENNEYDEMEMASNQKKKEVVEKGLIPYDPSTLPSFEMPSQPAQSSSPFQDSSSPHGLDNTHHFGEVDIPMRDVRTSYTAEETLRIFQAYVDITGDPIIANRLKARTFWEKVAERYNEVRPGGAPQRTSRMLRAHFDRANPEIKKFCIIYNNLESQGRSEANEVDILTEAMTTYQEENKKPFKHVKTWEKVRHCKKWAGNGEASPKRAKYSSGGQFFNNGEANPVPSDFDVEPSSPVIGQKTGKRKTKTKGEAIATSSAAADDMKGFQSALENFSEAILLSLYYKAYNKNTSQMNEEKLRMHLRFLKSLETKLGFS